MQVILLLVVKEKRKQVMDTNGVMKKYKIKIKNPVMGVPITFLFKYNPTQFEIIGLMSGAKDSSLINGNDGRAKFYINGKGVYARILIRKIMK